MHFNRRKFLGAFAAGGLSAPTIVKSAFAQSDFPNKPITFVVPFAPGSGADVFTRFYANMLEKVSGASTIVENKAGAGGIIGAQHVARSKPDGYTALIIPGIGVLAMGPSLYKNLPFDPVNDFEHVTTLHQTVSVLVVAANSPFQTVQDLVSYLKEKGENAAYGSPGGNQAGVISELIKSQFGLKTREVKFPAFPPTLNEMTAGNISFAILDNAQAMAHINGGRIRGLSLCSAERMASVPGIPGAREAGIPNLDITSWVSLHLPKGVPSDIVQKYVGWFHEVLAAEDTKKFLATSGASVFENGPAETKALLEQAVKNWAGYIKLAGVEPQ